MDSSNTFGLFAESNLASSEMKKSDSFEIRMSEFCSFTQNKPILLSCEKLNRPKSSVSPLNLSNEGVDSSLSIYLPQNDANDRNQIDLSYLQSSLSNNFSYIISPNVNKISQPYLTLPNDSGFHQSYQNTSSVLSSSPFNVSNKSAFKSTAANRFLMSNFQDDPKNLFDFNRLLINQLIKNHLA